ncbi:glycosyltransferase family 1 protein [Microbacterium sp. NPDC089180]|uniref:Glycosyltransferase family 1 protein n=1 Tax=Microbacterium galbum TaxID=3075994 RepID=A0ABU3T9Q2_9MICO|nr:glycosyltransferase family 1 protein [Microbacterium sp. KSW4-17]MDU0368069.1 glycosyltransferase family 1 protein [Microbacterium sp. KSW4-17]
MQRFAREVTRALATMRPVTVVAPPGDLIDADLGAEIVQVGRLSGHAWEQVALPLHLRRSGSPLLLGLANTGPVAYRPQVVTCHDIIWARHPESFARSFRLLYATMTPLLLRRSAHVLTVSPFSRGELVREFGIDPRRITVVANAVSPAFHADGPAHDEGVPYVLAVSSPNRHKNFDALVAAFEAADLTHIHRLLIVGQQARAFHTQATTAAPRTRALGRVDDDELMRLYRGATAFAFPSLYEGFGIPPLEAQRMGTPVLAARSSALPDVLGDSALWVDPHDIDDMRRGLETLDGDPALRADLARRGRENEARFSWEASARRVSDVIDRVMTTRR